MKRESTNSSTACRSGSNQILVLAPNWLGDAVMSLPFFLQLGASFPESRLTVSCNDYVFEVYRREPAVDRFIRFRKGFADRVSGIRKGRPKGGWGLCFVLPPSFSSALTAFLAGTARRVGYGTELRSFLLTDPLKGESYKRGHLTDVYMKLVEEGGGQRGEGCGYPVVVPPEDWKDIIEDAGIRGNYAVLCAGASYGPAKRWPARRFSSLSMKLAEEMGLKTVKVGSESEKEYLDSIEGGKGADINIAGKVGVRGLISVLKGASVVVGNDSGPVHIASALGIPTVSIFGSTSPDWTAPRGKRSLVLSSELECSPCFKRECPLYDHAKCLDDITVREVYNAIHEVLRGG